MKRCLLFLLFSIVSIAIYAYDFSIVNDEGTTLYYNFRYILGDADTTVYVTYKDKYATHGSYSGDIKVPEIVFYNSRFYNVTSVASDAFKRCNGLTSVVLPNSITSIGQNAFLEDSALISAVIPEGLKSIGKSAFYGCVSLEGITLPSTLRSVGTDAFTGCLFDGSKFANNSELDAEENNYWGAKIYDKKTDDGFLIRNNSVIGYLGNGGEIAIPDGTTAISENAFYWNKNITAITIPESVTKIAKCAFLYCKGLESIKIPVSIDSIQNYTFGGCSSLKDVEIPNTVAYIGNEAFSSTDIQNLVLPNTFKSLNGIFGESSAKQDRETVYIPNSISWIDRYAVNDFKDVSIEDGDGTICCRTRSASDGEWDGVFSNAVNLYVGGDVYSASNFRYDGQLFNGCNNSVTHLESLTFGPKVQKVFTSGYELADCDKLTKVTCLSKIPFPCPKFFYSTFTLYVPLGSKDDYESADGWKSFPIEEVTEVFIKHNNTIETYTPDFDLDFSSVDGLKAYVFRESLNGVAYFKEVTSVHAGEGVLLSGDIGTYTIPCTNLSTQNDEEYALKGTISGKYISEFDSTTTNYVLNVADKGTFVFKKADKYYGTQLSRNQAYISLPTSSAQSDTFTISFSEPLIASGTSGTCTWEIGTDSILTIKPTNADDGTLGTWTGTMYDFAPWRSFRNDIKAVKLEGRIKAQTCNGMFRDCIHLTNVSIDSLDTRDATSMAYMFWGCSELDSLSLNCLNTSNVTSMVYMFRECSKLKTLLIDNFNTSNVTDISEMFGQCKSLTSLDLKNFNTSNVKEMSGMFSGCTNLASLNMDNFDTRNVTSMNSLFRENHKLTELHIGKFDTSNVTDMRWMFYGCNSLDSLNLNNFNTSNVNDMSGMFCECSNLKSLNLTHFNTSNVTSMNMMFTGCSSLKCLNLTHFDAHNVTDTDIMFLNCSKLGRIMSTTTTPSTLIDGIFSSLPAKSACKLYVPSAAHAAYSSAAGWQEIADIIGVDNGDVNLDETVNENDAIEIIDNILGEPSDQFEQCWADINNDSIFTIADASAVLNAVNKKEAGTSQAKQIVATTDDEMSFYRTGTNKLTVGMNNKTGYTAFQFDIILPEGLSLEDVAFNPSRCAEFKVKFHERSANKYTIAVFNPQNNIFATGSGSLVDIVTSGTANNEDIVISNIHFAKANAQDVLFEDLMFNDATRVDDPVVKDSRNTPVIHDLSGLKLSKTQRGVNIIDGKKIIRK